MAIVTRASIPRSRETRSFCLDTSLYSIAGVRGLLESSTVARNAIDSIATNTLVLHLLFSHVQVLDAFSRRTTATTLRLRLEEERELFDIVHFESRLGNFANFIEVRAQKLGLA